MSRALILIALVLTSAPASAQHRTDVVTLANGDRITGEILTLERGRLRLKTDDAGTIDIEWDHINYVESTRQFEIVTSNGRLLVGTLVRGEAQSVALGAANVVTQLPMAQVTEIAPIGSSFWTKLEGSLDAGFSYTRSSGIAQINFNTDIRYRRPSFVFRLTGATTLTEQSDGTERDDRSATEFSYVRYRGGSWFVAGATRFENNESLGLVLRSQVGGLIGRRLVNTNRSQVELGGGLVGNQERGVDTDPTENLEGLILFQSSYYSYDRPKTNIDVAVQYYPGLSDWGRQRVQVDGSLKREVWKDFFVAFNGFVTFDSRPPNPEADQTDSGVSVSAGWSF